MFYGRRLANGDGLAVTLALRDTDAASINGTYSSVSMRTSYAFGKQLGPAKITAALGAEYADYPLFRLSGVIAATDILSMALTCCRTALCRWLRSSSKMALMQSATSWELAKTSSWAAAWVSASMNSRPV